ncbi:D-sedoheptulose-7-phosphate isomerase [Flavitalea sp.]|nr:SIS domain-containing protein [Flavitalea sp.]
MNNKIKKIIAESISVKSMVLENEALLQRVEEIVTKMVTALQNGNRIYFAGNGGSAADAQHLAAEFSGRFYIDREALPAEALHCNTSYLTAVANDYSYDVVYARLIKGLGMKGDFLVGLSTSGNSKNIIKAFEVARERGIITVGMTGETGGGMVGLSDYLLNIPSKNTPRIQESHMLLGHIICELVEEQYFAK